MRRRLPVALALAAVAAALAPMLGIGFVSDDHQIIRFALHGPHPNFAALLSRAEVIEVYYRPLFDLTLGVDFLVWGWTSMGFRLTTLALHLANTSLVFVLAQRLELGRRAALGALLVFGLHPIHEMSLFWIAGRTDVLCTTFYLASLVLFIDNRRVPSIDTLVGSIAFAVLALLSKEMALSLMLVVPLLAWWTRREYEMRAYRRAFDIVRASTPYVVVTAGVLLARLWLLDNDLFASEGVHASVGAPTLVRNLATYLGLLIVPAGHESIASIGRAYPMLFLSVAAVALVTLAGVLIRWRRAAMPIVLCTLAIIATLVPVMRLAMRWYLYLPSVFFAMALGWLFARAWERNRMIAATAASIVVIAYATIDFVAIAAWKDASHLAGQLGSQLRTLVNNAREGDTLRFATIPGKLGTAPVFNLGFTGTVEHLLGLDGLTILVASKLNMQDYPSRVAMTGSAGGDSLTLEARSGESFTVGSHAVDAAMAERPRRVTIALEPRTATWYSFDGSRFARMP